MAESASASLFDEINALFEPPVNTNTRTKNYPNYGGSSSKISREKFLEQASASKTVDDPNWKKPRANSHEYCDSCGCTEGDRLVCDRCPASFHLECLDPPMDPDEATTGVWYCHKCSLLNREEDDNLSVTSEKTDLSSRSQIRSPTFNFPISRTTVDNYFSSRRMHSTVAGPNPAKCGHPLVDLISDCEGVAEMSELSLLWQMFQYACHLNPKEFELPKNLIPGFKIPQSYKWDSERKNRGVIECENGIIPKPIRICYVCSNEPLQCCDYCDACFHLTCLSPPLTHFPPRCERWMCPNHAEKTVDNHLLTSLRLSERFALWDSINQLSDPMVQPSSFDLMFSSEAEQHILVEFLEEIKRKYVPTNKDSMNMDFLEKCQTYSIPNDSSLTKFNMSMGRNTSVDRENFNQMRCKVPNAVKSLYKKRNYIESFKEEYEGDIFKAEPERKEFLSSLLSFFKEAKTISKNEDSVISSTLKGKKESQDVSIKQKTTFYHPEIPCRAVLSPKNCTGPVFKMVYKQAKIGFNTDSHLNLDLYQLTDESFSKCTRISSHHSTIFYDAYSRLFELINYSEFGSFVDGTKFGIDCLDENGMELNSNELVREVQKLIRDGQDKKIINYGNKNLGKLKNKRFMMPAQRSHPLSSIDSCHCSPGTRNNENSDYMSVGYKLDKDESGFEGSAVLRQGSIIKFGCYEFLFSIVELDELPAIASN